MDLLTPRAAPSTPTRRAPRVVDPLAGLTADPFDTVHRRNGAAPSAAPAPAPVRSTTGAAPSARGTQIFTDL